MKEMRLSIVATVSLAMLMNITRLMSAQESDQSSTSSETPRHVERDGLLVVEAENFDRQTNDNVRRFHIVGKGDAVSPRHVESASGGAYVAVLPDTRRTHDDKLIRGENFSDEPGAIAVLTYRVRFQTPGKYYVWARAYSTGTEDNGIHVGIDGQWPESGRRMQWCEGKNRWRWESKQRTPENHCGEPYKIFVEVIEPGEHEIQFSMREDGFELDRWLMTLEKDFERPEGTGPAVD